MNRRNLIAGIAGSAAVAAAGGGGFMAWASAGAADWRATTESLRRPLDPAGGIAELVRYATLAANSHNTQPWRFAASARSVAIAPDLSRRTPVVDPDDHHLFASLGCAAENIIQAAPLLGLAAAVGMDGEAIRIDLAPSGAPSGTLAAAIPRRQCTRADYDGRAVEPSALATLAAAAEGDGVSVRLITDKPAMEDTLAFIVDANTVQVRDPAFVAELKRWLRFSYGEAVSTGDGLFAACSGNPVLPGPVGSLMFGLVFGADSENRKIVSQVRSSAGLVVFVSEKDDRRHWIDAGRAYQRFALQATVLGIRRAFLNQPVEVAEVRRRFADHLGLGDRRPDLVVRFGYGPEMPLSLRRPVGDVMSA